MRHLLCRLHAGSKPGTLTYGAACVAGNIFKNLLDHYVPDVGIVPTVAGNRLHVLRGKLVRGFLRVSASFPFRGMPLLTEVYPA